MKDLDSRELNGIVRELGADMVGVASGDCVEITPKRRGPRNVLPEARSVVVFGKRMLAGSIESPRDEVSTCQNIVLYQALDRISFELGTVLEQRGYRAAIVPSYIPVEMSSETKGFVGVVSLRHVAQAAGLGMIGKNNLLLTPDLGPRVRLGGLVTDALVEPDHPFDEDLCSDCEACIAVCPADALSEPGKTHTGRCVRKVLPYGLSGLTKHFTEKLAGSKKELKAFLTSSDFWNIYQSIQYGLHYGCHACINACPIGRK